MTFNEAKAYLLARAKAMSLELEVLATESRELTLNSFGGNLSEITRASQGGVGVRVVVGGRFGYAYSEEKTEEALDWILREARENAELSSADDGFLPEGSSVGHQDLISEGLSAPLTEKGERATKLEQALREDERTKQVWITYYTEREVLEELASTNGAEGGYRNGFAGLISSLVMQEGESIKQGVDISIEKEFHALDPMTTAQKMIETTARHLGARPLKTGRYRAYLEPRVVAQLLGVLMRALSGKALIEGKSRFADRLGEEVASDRITLVDDPTLSDGLASRPFDSEGTPARAVTLIEGGVLRSFLHNSYTARKAGHENTGHASRSYRSTLDVGFSNLSLQTGEGVDLVDGVLVTDLLGLHAGANPITGDLSLQAFGIRIEGDERYPVENFAISGNLFELLKRVSAVGDESEWHFAAGAIGAPMLEIESLSFAGA